MTIQVGDPTAEADFQFDWAPQLATGVTLTQGGVTHTVPSPLTLVTEATDVANSRSTVRVAGGAHGGVYVMKALATLSNGEKIPGSFTRRIFAGASA